MDKLSSFDAGSTCCELASTVTVGDETTTR
jgi:hypothetical protein